MSESAKYLNITGGGLLARNSIYNIMGQVLPTLAALFSIPILINAMGASGFGVLTLVWMVTGYFSLLDLGLSRALTKNLSEKLGRGDLDDIPNLIWTALMLAFLMGLVGALMISLSSTTFAYDLFKIPSVLQEDVEKSFYILSISLPIVICNTVLRAVLESHQRFDIVNMIRAPIGSLTFLGPVLVLLFTEKLSHIVIALVASRLLESVITFFYCIRVVPSMLKNVHVNVSYISMFLIFGGWTTISSIVGPLMLYLDRFLIGSIISITAVAYYATSHEIIIRLMVIPGAIVGVLFPAMGAELGPNPSKAINMFFAGVKYTFITLFPVILIIFIFAEEGLRIWLGNEFSVQGTTVLQLLAIGALISSLSYFPFAMLHASGRPDLPAKLHLIESPFYLIVAWILIIKYGIEGAAIAWVSRATLDTIVLYYMAGRELKITYPISRIMLITLSLGAFLLFSMFLSQGLYYKISTCLIGFPLLLVFSWKKILDSSERSFVLKYANRLYVSRKSSQR